MNEREIEPTVLKKANQYISFKFGNVQFLDIMNFLGGATSLDSFLAYKTIETKGFFPYEWFDSPEKLTYPTLPPYNEFFSRLRNCNPLDKAHSDYQSFVNSGCSSEEALKKLREFLQFLPQDKRIMHIYSKYGKTTSCNHSKIFFDGTITRMLCQRLKRLKK